MHTAEVSLAYDAIEFVHWTTHQIMATANDAEVCHSLVVLIRRERMRRML